MMIEETQLHLISSIIILGAAAIPVYLTAKLSGDLKRLTAILSVFIFIHAIYQIVSFYGFKVLADSVFEPLTHPGGGTEANHPEISTIHQ